MDSVLIHGNMLNGLKYAMRAEEITVRRVFRERRHSTNDCGQLGGASPQKLFVIICLCIAENWERRQYLLWPCRVLLQETWRWVWSVRCVFTSPTHTCLLPWPHTINLYMAGPHVTSLATSHIHCMPVHVSYVFTFLSLSASRMSLCQHNW
jgi:hypothetical protein